MCQMNAHIELFVQIDYNLTDMNAQEIRQKYIEFMISKGHVQVPRANVVPQEDATTLFTGSGMQPMVPFLLGATHPEGTRIVNSQVCIRAEDIDEVGDASHFTMFEMLGNWSLGEYFKKEQIEWMCEFLFDIVGLDMSRVYVTCYIGNESLGIPRDDEAIELWKEQFSSRGIDAKVVEIGSAENGDIHGMQGGRIFLYDGHENWWSRGGAEATTPLGDPCGPDSEMFFDFGEQYHDEEKWGKAHPASDSPRFFEIGNNVFMSYRKTKDGMQPLENKNIDHGSGVERIASAVLDEPDGFKTSLFWPIIEKLQVLSGKTYEENTSEMRMIADHLKACMFIAVDGVAPGNTAQAYVSRRLLRRAVRFGQRLGIENNLVESLLPVVADIYSDMDDVKSRYEEVLTILTREEQLFRKTLNKGVREFAKLTRGEELTGAQLFILYDTYGFPVELSIEEAESLGVSLAANWEAEYEALMKQQKERSRTATQGQFKGGLEGHDDIHKKYHTATHLMYKALRIVLGEHVVQRGSNITSERLRFDFSHPEKMTDEQKQQVEDIVNEQIANNLPMGFVEMPTTEALKKGALGAFGDKYGETVKVYAAGKSGEEPFSFEICGGPHVEHTGQLGEDGRRFVIKKEQASSAGVRRIKAVLQ